MALVDVLSGQGMVASQVQQLIDLLKGTMTTQPVTLTDGLQVSGAGFSELALNNAGNKLVLSVTGGSARLQLGAAAGNTWEIDNNSGQFRIYRPGLSAVTIDPTVAAFTGDVRTAARLIAGADPGGGVAGDVIANRGGASPGTGVVYFGSSGGSHYLYYDGTKFNLPDDLALPVSGSRIQLFDSSGTPNKYLRANAGSFQVWDSAFANRIFDLADNGDVHLRGGLFIPIDPPGNVYGAASGPGTVPVLLAKQTVSGVTSVSFTSIPQGYTNLQLRVSLRTTATLSELIIQFNGDTTSGNYFSTIMWVNPTYSSGSNSRSSIQLGYNPATTNPTVPTVGLWEIFDYADTTVNTIVQGQYWQATSTTSPGTAGSLNPGIVWGWWRSSAAVTSMLIGSNTGITFSGQFSLWGTPG